MAGPPEGAPGRGRELLDAARRGDEHAFGVREAVARFIDAFERGDVLRYLTTRANGQIAMGVYALRPDRDAHVAIALDVLALDGAAIANVTAFRAPGVLAAFGLPAEIPRHG